MEDFFYALLDACTEFRRIPVSKEGLELGLSGVIWGDGK